MVKGEMPRREVDIYYRRRRHFKDAISTIKWGWVAERCEVAPTIGNDVAQMMDDSEINRLVKRTMIGGEDKRNVGARSDRVGPFDVQRSLKIPVSLDTVRVVGYAGRLHNLKIC